MVGIYAHRGASFELPENTLSAFARAIELKADGIELDVHLSSDGIPVVIHDDTVDRTTNGTGEVAAHSAAELQALDAGQSQPIPTLKEVLDLVAGKLHVDIEIKAGAAGDAVLVLTSQYPDLEFAISSFNHDALRHVRTVNGKVELWPLTAAVTDDVIHTALALGSPQIAAYDRMLNEEIVAEVRRQGLSVWVWTVNDIVRALELVNWGVVGICTDDPATVIQALKKR
ncbi:MAG TPA: glycerophosphodiester phosphodiesterase family protein [Thermomicrobiales bacterium]|nr:glycerophosphodiester phosphodiesterase family protein [Thermomicrobiales bacterium]